MTSRILLVSGRPGSLCTSVGDGTLVAKPLTLFGNWQVAIADMNRDGKGDLLLSDTTSGAVSIVLGNGDGTFRSPDFSSSRKGSWGRERGSECRWETDLLAVDQNLAELYAFVGQGDGTVVKHPENCDGHCWRATVDFDRRFKRRPESRCSGREPFSRFAESVYRQRRRNIFAGAADSRPSQVLVMWKWRILIWMGI